MNETLRSIANRRSTRQFSREQISDEDLQSIIDAAQQAPTGHNDQSCYFVVIQNGDLIKELSDGSKAVMQKSPVDWIARIGKNDKLNIYYDAPTVIIVASRKDAVSPLPDVCAAVENIMIAAESLGIGSCWIGFTKFNFNSPEKDKRIGIPDGYEVHYGVALGHKPDGSEAAQPPRKYDKYFHVIK